MTTFLSHSACQHTTVVIPTRNRAQLAVAAISSVLDQQDASVRILVSDNSTDDMESSQLASFCSKLDRKRVIYARPDTPMAMSDHWEWALRVALSTSDDSHLLYLSDRMVFKQRTLPDLTQIAGLYPDRVISYDDDMVDDSTEPIQLHMRDWTGKLFEIDTDKLLQLSSRAFYPPCIPRMMNSLVPRSILKRMQDRFGTVFGSISPDFYFAYRCLYLLDSIFYYDKPILIQYAISRSNGITYARGTQSADNADFIAQLGGKRMNFAAPIPDFQSITNAVLNEYCLVRAETGSAKFPAIDRVSYLGEVGLGLRYVRDPDLARRTKALLRSNGWTVANRIYWFMSRFLFLLVRDPSWVVKRFARRVAAKLVANSAGRIRMGLASEWLLQFPSVATAIRYANEYPRKATSSMGYLRRCKLTDQSGYIREVELDGNLAKTAELH